MKEADHLFYKQKWYPAMEMYQHLAERYPRCAEAYTKWALCWECTGMVKRAEDVLRHALNFYLDRGWMEQSELIHEQLRSMTRNVTLKSSATSTPTAPGAGAPYPNLMFRGEFKWKGKSRD